MPQLTNEEYIHLAETNGAKIYRDVDINMWSLLDMPNTVLWFAYFRTKGTAAWAYCFHKQLVNT